MPRQPCPQKAVGLPVNFHIGVPAEKIEDLMHGSLVQVCVRLPRLCRSCVLCSQWGATLPISGRVACPPKWRQCDARPASIRRPELLGNLQLTARRANCSTAALLASDGAPFALPCSGT